MLSRKRGFTLIELLVVLAIVALLVSLALPRYFHSVDVARDAALKQTLHEVRTTIDKFYGDTGHYPQDLNELVEKKYLRSLPFDPVTQSTTGWSIMPPENSDMGGVYDLHSTASGSDLDGVPYVNY